jgi:hypothetical protein
MGWIPFTNTIIFYQQLKTTSRLIVKNLLRFSAITLSVAILSGCASFASTTICNNKIVEKKLASGKLVRMGFKAPPIDCDCHEIALYTYGWNKHVFETKMSSLFADEYDTAHNKAIDYANQNNINANYVFTKIPVEVKVGGVNVTAASRAYVHYYHCKKPPELSNSIF